MMIRVKSIEYLKDYQLMVFFSDGKAKIVNFESLISGGGELLDPLQDVKYFKKVKMDKFKYSISWPNGADFCPDVLYELGENVKAVRRKLPEIKNVHRQTLKNKIRSKEQITKTPKKRAIKG